MSDFVKLTVEAGVATLLLDSPATRNALGGDEQLGEMNLKRDV